MNKIKWGNILTIILVLILLAWLFGCVPKPVVHHPDGTEVYYGQVVRVDYILQSAQCPGESRLVYTDQGMIFRICCKHNKIKMDDPVWVYTSKVDLFDTYLVIDTLKCKL